MLTLDKIIIGIIQTKNSLLEKGKNPKYLILGSLLHKELMSELKDSLAYSEMGYSILRKIEEIENEVQRFDLKISTGTLFGLHIIVSEILSEMEYMIL